MDYVIGVILVAEGDENLLAVDPESVAVAHRLAPQGADVGAGMGSVRFMVPVHSPVTSFGR